MKKSLKNVKGFKKYLKKSKKLKRMELLERKKNIKIQKQLEHNIMILKDTKNTKFKTTKNFINIDFRNLPRNIYSKLLSSEEKSKRSKKSKGSKGSRGSRGSRKFSSKTEETGKE